MAKRNEENLSKLKGEGLFSKLKKTNYRSKRKTYRYKKASSKQLLAIKEHLETVNGINRKKRIILFTLVSAIMIISLMVLMTVQF